MKRCIHCHRKKRATEFHHCRDKQDGRATLCSKCRNTLQRARHAALCGSGRTRQLELAQQRASNHRFSDMEAVRRDIALVDLALDEDFDFDNFPTTVSTNSV